MIAFVGEGTAVEQLMGRVQAGDLRSLARAISLVEDRAPEAAAILDVCAPHRGKALLVGITGPPGAGKSTLVDQMTRQLRTAGKSIAIVAVDPTSPFTGGALLGDRIRMNGFAGDDGVYIRSLASRGAKGGIASAAAGVCAILEAAGREVMLIETMGVGQDEIEIARLADVTVLVLVPGMGDEVQSLKAGIMEVADIFVINKADHEGTELLRAGILAMQETGGTEDRAGVIATVATTGTGVEELLKEIERIPRSISRQERRAGRTAADTSLRLDHIGIAVRSIASSRSFYEALGMTVSREEVVEHQQVVTAMLELGETRLELLEATASDSAIGRFIEKRGEGLHHIAIRADDLEGKLDQMQHAGVRLVSDSVKTGAGGHRYFFLHPASTGGVLVEIVGDAVPESGKV